MVKRFGYRLISFLGGLTGWPSNLCFKYYKICGVPVLGTSYSTYHLSSPWNSSNISRWCNGISYPGNLLLCSPILTHLTISHTILFISQSHKDLETNRMLQPLSSRETMSQDLATPFNRKMPLTNSSWATLGCIVIHQTFIKHLYSSILFGMYFHTCLCPNLH